MYQVFTKLFNVFLFVLLIFSSVITTNAQILTYTNSTAGAYATIASNSTCSSGLTRVNGCTAPGSPCGTGFSNTSFTNTTTYSTSLAAVEVYITANSGYQLNVTGFSVGLRRSGTGPASAMLAYSTDGGTTWINQGSPASPSNSSCGTTSTASWLPTAFNCASIKFRIYGYNASSTAGTFQVLNLTISGSVNASGPSIAISNTSPVAGSIAASSTNQILQTYSLGVTSATATLTGLTITTGGTYTAGDISNLKCYYSTSSTLTNATVGSATLLSTYSTADAAGSKVFPSFTSQSITSSTTGYLYITANVGSSPTVGHTINVNATTSNFTFSSGTVSGSPSISNNQTISNPCSGTPAAGTVTVGSSPICSGNTSSLTLTGGASGTGLSYQWYSNSVNTFPGSGGLITGAVSSAYTPPSISTTTYYWCTTTCSGLSNTSTSGIVSVNPLPTVAAITGGVSVLPPTGIVTFSDATTGTTTAWSSSNTSIATVDPVAGIVYGAGSSAGGMTIISYTVTNSGCSASAIQSVNIPCKPAPNATNDGIGVSTTGANSNITTQVYTLLAYLNNYGTYGVVTYPGATFNYTEYNHSTSYAAYPYLWIDYNQNGVFETTELANTPTSTGAGSNTGSLTCTVSSTASLGTTIMRVASFEGTASATGCGSGATYGSTMDLYATILPFMKLTSSSASTCIGGNAVYTVSATYGSPTTYDIAWTGSPALLPNVSGATLGGAGTTFTVSVNPSLASGTYTGSITVHSGAYSSYVGAIPITLNVIPLPTSVGTLTNSGPIYAGTTLNLYSSGASGGTAPYTYSWTDPTTVTHAGQNPSFTASTTSYSGTYTCTVTDNNGCKLSGTEVVLVNNPNYINTSPTAFGPFCNNVSNSVSVAFTSGGTGAVGTYTVQLSNSSGSFTTPAATATGSSSPITLNIPASLTAGTGYRINVINSSITGTDNGTNITISSPTVGANVSANQTICSGSSPASFTASGYTGAILYWLTSTSPTFATTSTVASSAGLTTLPGSLIGSLTAQTYVEAVVQSPGCLIKGSYPDNTWATVSINPVPTVSSISGLTSVEAYYSIALSDATAGGVWSSANASIASVDGLGNVYGMIGGSNTNISYTVTNSYSCSTTNTFNVVVTNYAYCSPTVTSSSQNSMSYYTTGALSNIGSSGSPYTQTSNFAINTATIGITTKPGQTVSYVFGNPSTFNTTYYCNTWIDWNNNGIFGGVITEDVMPSNTYQTITYGGGTYSNSFTVPTGQTPGEYAMRLGVSESSSTLYSNPCGSGYGTVADFYVKVLPTITLSGTPAAVCQGYNAVQNYSSSTGSPNQYSIVWNSGALAAGFSNVSLASLSGGSFNIPTPATIVGGITTPTTYTGTLYVYNSSASSFPSAGQSITVTVNPAPVITVGSNALCSYTSTVNVPVTATASIGTVNIWSASSGGTNLATGLGTISYNPTVAVPSVNTYYVDGVYGGCTTTTRTAVTATANSTPVITTAPTTMYACIGSPATFTAAASGTPTSYSWKRSTDGGTTYSTINVSTDLGVYSGYTTTSLSISSYVSGLAGYMYQIVATNSCGSATSSSATVNTGSTPSITSQPSSSSACIGGSATFNAVVASGSTYQWMVSTTAGGSTYTNLSNGTYSGASFTGVLTPTLTVSSITDATLNGYNFKLAAINCGTVTTTPVTLTVNAVPTASITTPAAICVGGTATLTATYTGGPTSYSWTGTNLASTSTTSSTTATPTATAVYSLTVSSSGSGCTSPVYTTTATVNAQPTATITPTAICVGGTASLTATYGGSPTSYSWTGTNLASTSTSASTTATQTATATYSLTVSSSGSGCTTSPVYTTSVTVNAVPSATINIPAAICVSGTASLTATYGGSPTTYSWSGSNLASTSTTSSTTATPTATAVYSLTVSKSGSGCTSPVYTTTATVDTALAPSPIYGNPYISLGYATYLQDSTLGGTWSSNNTAIATTASNGLVYGAGNGTATMSYTVSNACGPASATYPVSVNFPASNPVINTIAGNGTSAYAGDGAAATAAELNSPWGVAVDNSGNVYIADCYNNRIRKINTSGIISTIAGNGTAGFSGDGGAATAAKLNYPNDVAVDNSGNVYIADQQNQRIRKINTSGIISTIAGNGTAGFLGDGGAATATEFQYPTGVAVDNSGNVYIADESNFRIRKINTSGIISTIAGNGIAAYAGDGGAATAAELYNPTGVAVDNSGNVYIADQSNQRIRKINTSGIISTIAGNGTYGFSGDGGAATAAKLNNPYGVAVDNSGNVYIADQSNKRIRNINTSGIISTIAGNGTYGFSGDGGAATAAKLDYTTSVAVDNSGNVYFAEVDNNRIRKIVLPLSPVYGSYTTMCVGSTITLNDTSAGGTWSSSNSAVASVNPTGLVSGISTGAATISYTTLKGYATWYITVNAVPSATINIPAAICVGGTASLTATYGGSPTTYSWAGTNLASTSTTSSTTATPTATAVYSLTVSSSGSGCTSTVYTTTATVNAQPTATITPTAICVGGTASLTATYGGSPTSYSWTGTNLASTSTSASTTATPTATATYSLTVSSSGSGCTTSPVYTTTATVNAQPTATINIPAAICVGGTASLTATYGGSPTSYSWTGTNLASTSTSASTTATPTATATYSLTVSSSGSGCTTSPIYTTSVTVNAVPTATINSVAICTGNVGTLTATYAGSPTIYAWSGSNITSTSTGVSITANPTLTTTYSLTVSNSLAGCFSTTTGNISVNTLPSVTASSSTNPLCTNGTLNLSATPTGGAAPYSYSWTNASGYTATGASPMRTGVTSAMAGVYSVSVTDANGCSALTAGVTPAITVDPVPSIGTISILHTNICSGYVDTINQAGTIVTPSTGTVTYTWSGPAGSLATTGTLATGAQQIFTASSTAYSGIYSLIATYTESGCSVNPAVTLSINVAPAASLSLTASRVGVICPAVVETLTATASGGTGTPIITWSGPGFSAPVVVSGSPATYTLVPTISGSYTASVTYTGTLGCSVSQVSGTITPGGQSWLTTAATTDWNTATNWACGYVPIASDSVIIHGATNEPVLSSGTGNLYNLSIDSDAVITLNSGTLLNLLGTLTGTGTITGSGKVVFNSSTQPQIIKGNVHVTNIQINNSNGVSIYPTGFDSLTVNGTLSITNGTFSTSNCLVLAMQDASSSMTSGRIDALTSSSAKIAGNVIVQQVLQPWRAWRFFAHPFVDSMPLSKLQPYIDISGDYGAARGFTTTVGNNASVYKYNQVCANSTILTGLGDPGWTPFTWCKDSVNGLGVHVSNDSNEFKRFEGIRMFMRGSKGQGLDSTSGYTVNPAIIRMYGRVDTGSLTVTLHKGPTLIGSNPIQDYNFIGNPYPSSINIGTVVNSAFLNGKLNSSVVSIWDPHSGAAGIYRTFDSSNNSTLVIPANSAFMVRAAYEGATLHFTENNKATGQSYSELRNTASNALSLNIYDANYHLWDLLNIKWNEFATDADDVHFDGGKPVNPGLNFYSWSADRHPLSIDSRPFAAGKVIPLGITSDYKQDFIIRADQFTAPQGTQVYLHDKYLEKYVLLEQGTEYTFTISKDEQTQGDQRFELGLATSEQPIVTAAQDNLHVLMLPNPASNTVTVTFNSPETANTTVRLTSMEGVCVLAEQLGDTKSGSVTLSIENLASGIYMVEFTSGNKKVVQRLVKE